MSSLNFAFDRETEIRPSAAGVGEGGGAARGDARFDTEVSQRWNIGENPNGGYLATAALRAMAVVAEQPDPLSVTTHYLRPGSGGDVGHITSALIRPGRRATTVQAELHQHGKQRLQMVGAFGNLALAEDLRPTGAAAAELAAKPVAMPDPDDCVDRRSLEQGVELPILDRLDVRIDPRWAVAGASDEAVVAGWIRFADGRPVDTMALMLFADAFPPSVFSMLGTIGWVPTLELTVHLRRRPEPGWIRARFVTEDLTNGMLIESGELWDSSGQLVAKSRQLALLLS